MLLPHVASPPYPDPARPSKVKPVDPEAPVCCLSPSRDLDLPALSTMSTMSTSLCISSELFVASLWLDSSLPRSLFSLIWITLLSSNALSYGTVIHLLLLPGMQMSMQKDRATSSNLILRRKPFPCFLFMSCPY